MLHLTLNRIRAGLRHLLLTVVAVALGTTFLTAALVISGSTRAALDDSYALLYAGADVIVRSGDSSEAGSGGTAPLPASTLQHVLAVPGVADGEARTSSVAQLLVPGRDGQTAVALGVPADPAESSIDVRSGRLPRNTGEVAIDAASTEQGIAVGDVVEVLLPTGVQQVEVVGTVGFGRLDGLAGGARVLFDEATATRLLGAAGPTELAVRAEAGTSPDDLAARLADILGAEATVLTADEAAATEAAAAARQVAVLSYVVLAVAVIALVVGGFLVANTFRMLVAQRIRELALLRAVGATRRQVGSSIRLEAAITGALGSVLGVALGAGAGAVAVSLSSGLLPGLPPSAPTVTAAAVVAGPVVGVGVALLAAHGAARRGLAVAPVAALRSATLPETRPSRLRGVLGLLLLAVGAASAVTGSSTSTTVLLGFGAASLIIGVGLVFPLVTGPVLALLSRPLARVGITGSLARGQALAAPRRTGATAAALAVTLALITFLLVFSASLGAATPDLLAGRQHADFLISSSAPEGLHDAMFAIAEEADRLPAVAAARVVTYGELQVTDPGGADRRGSTASAYVVDPAAVGQLFDVSASRGQLEGVAAGQLAVRDTLAEAQGWEVGDRLAVRFPDGTSERVTIAASFTGAITTDWIVPPETASEHLPGAYREAYVTLAEGATTAEVAPLLDEIVAGAPAVDVLSREELGKRMAEENESTLGILTALFALSLVVGVLGVANTLTLAVYSRIREIGLLRAVGATRGQVRAILRWEAALTSLLGALLGTVLGLSAAWLALAAIPGQSLPFTLPLLHVGAAVLSTALLGVVGSIVPALRAARIDVLHALQHT